MALKLEMSKAYDLVECEYLKAMPLLIGYDGKFVILIMPCV